MFSQIFPKFLQIFTKSTAWGCSCTLTSYTSGPRDYSVLPENVCLCTKNIFL